MIRLKNILAENMLRFGSKNLSESEKRNLQRLIEQDFKMPENIKGFRIIESVQTATEPTMIDAGTEFPGSQYVYFDENSFQDGTKYAFENDKVLVQTNFGNSGKIVAIGIPGTLKNVNAKWVYTPGTSLKVFTFSMSYLLGGDGNLNHEIAQGNDGLVSNLLSYTASTKNGKVTAAAIGGALAGVGVTGLSGYWGTVKSMVNMLATAGLTAAIADEDKALINTTFKGSYPGKTNPF